MKIIIKKVNIDYELVEIDGSLKSMQEIVGGYIEIVRLWNDFLLVCNEEGMLLNLKRHVIGSDVYCGDVLICKSCGSEMVGLSDDEIEEIVEGLGL